MSIQTYRYKVSHWILFIFCGMLCEIVTFGTLIKNIPDLLAGNFGVWDYVGLIFVILLIFPFGLLSFAVPFSSKIVVSLQGIEYYTLVAVIKVNWSDVSINKYSRWRTLVISKLDVVLKNWAKYLPWDAEKGIRELGIPFFEFGTFNPGNLIEILSKYAPPLKLKGN